ncbi:MAG: DUF4031 domain-containing protein [Promethearchaeota archaeon]
MIYTDGVHIVSDSSINGLHTFAKNKGLKGNGFKTTGYHIMT